MNRSEFDSLKDGDSVWVKCPYLTCDFPGVVKKRDGMMWVHINLFGYGLVKWGLNDPDDGDDEGIREKLMASLYRSEDVSKKN